ncbi:glycosyltransferase [Mycobacterium szulgai]|uniref:Glycosyltransferase 2-like domain-containing protein n=1 Tax=Mycobacterium szulgai TaxID=1787 RepID=A0A1X2DZR6_MYCSZ|nr:glycosyltransferase family A protein [Mycobacterium szulgai]MCV7075866.1 glycosyltransferase family 2 protein [Mycobacterium szulgai]ORW93159.1 hypothetical protein AWC27_00455 [Mycobacterium szulgai]
MSQLPTVAIVIPAYNEERFIAKCLDSCLDQTSTPEEIIVVNNKSTDDTVSVVRRYQENNPHVNIRLLEQNEYQGIAPTRNCGFDNAQSEVIGRIDADSIIANDWVQTVRSCFCDGGVDAATGPVVFYDMPLRSFTFWLDARLRSRAQRKATNERFLLGANMAIRSSAWKAVRHLTQLDLEDRLHEDVDLALTLFENDHEILYAPTMVAGMSGRRVNCSLRDYYRYAGRYSRTTKVHGISSSSARTAKVVLMLLYFPFRTMRFFYDGESLQFTWSKLRHELRKRNRVPSA